MNGRSYFTGAERTWVWLMFNTLFQVLGATSPHHSSVSLTAVPLIQKSTFSSWPLTPSTAQGPSASFPLLRASQPQGCLSDNIWVLSSRPCEPHLLGKYSKHPLPYRLTLRTQVASQEDSASRGNTLASLSLLLLFREHCKLSGWSFSNGLEGKGRHPSCPLCTRGGGPRNTDSSL